LSTQLEGGDDDEEGGAVEVMREEVGWVGQAGESREQKSGRLAASCNGRDDGVAPVSDHRGGAALDAGGVAQAEALGAVGEPLGDA
jgi:hypothetical protein